MVKHFIRFDTYLFFKQILVYDRQLCSSIHVIEFISLSLWVWHRFHGFWEEVWLPLVLSFNGTLNHVGLSCLIVIEIWEYGQVVALVYLELFTNNESIWELVEHASYTAWHRHKSLLFQILLWGQRVVHHSTILIWNESQILNRKIRGFLEKVVFTISYKVLCTARKIQLQYLLKKQVWSYALRLSQFRFFIVSG